MFPEDWKGLSRSLLRCKHPARNVSSNKGKKHGTTVILHNGPLTITESYYYNIILSNFNCLKKIKYFQLRPFMLWRLFSDLDFIWPQASGAIFRNGDVGVADLDRMNNEKAHINKSNNAIYDTISLLSVRFQLNIHVSFVGPLDGLCPREREKKKSYY